MSDERVQIPGSAPPHAAEARSVAAADPDRELTVTVMLRRPAPDRIGADPKDLDAVRDFAQRYGLSVVDEKPAARTLHLRGTVKELDAAFGTRLGEFADAQGHPYLSYNGPLSVPQSLAGVITAVLGLDQRPIARRGAAVSVPNCNF